MLFGDTDRKPRSIRCAIQTTLRRLKIATPHSTEASKPAAPGTGLPPDFTFSQSSLQAFEECPRRFWLTYLEQLPWPALEAAPVQEHEAWMRMGERFHRLVQRAEIGIDPASIAAGLEPPLSTWFAAYQSDRPDDLPDSYKAVEQVLSLSLPPAGRIAAKYDLIAAEPGGRAVIVDWKTARRRSEPSALRQRWQSILYPYLLVEASANLPWGALRPEQVEMCYWFTAAPSQPIRFRYDAAQHAANRQRIQQILQRLFAGQSEADFPKVADTAANRRRFCAYCIYRSRCNRGDVAGTLDLFDDEEEFFAVDPEKALAFHLDDIPELAF